MIFGYLLKKKSDALMAFKEFATWVENERAGIIKTMRTDSAKRIRKRIYGWVFENQKNTATKLQYPAPHNKTAS